MEKRTNVVLDDVLLQKAKSLTGIATTRGVIQAALETLVVMAEQAQVRDLRGTLHWEGDLDAMRRDGHGGDAG